jgi:transketolase
MNEGKDITLVATGHMLWYAVEAARKLESEGISVELINIHTIKPLDDQAILDSVRKTGCCVVAEEHQRAGGLGESIAALLAQHHPARMAFVAVNDSFGESGKPADLLEKYGLSIDDIESSCRSLLV